MAIEDYVVILEGIQENAKNGARFIRHYLKLQANPIVEAEPGDSTSNLVTNQTQRNAKRDEAIQCIRDIKAAALTLPNV